MRHYLLIFAACAFSGTAIPVPEDVTLVGSGTTITTPFGFLATAIAASAGLLLRDSVFFGIGHFAGESVFRWPFVQRFVGEERLAKGREMVDHHGGRAVLISRLLVGARATGFLVCGAMGVRVRDFALWDLLGLAITTPLLLLLGYALGEPILASVEWLLEHRWVGIGVVVGAVLAWFAWKRFRAR